LNKLIFLLISFIFHARHSRENISAILASRQFSNMEKQSVRPYLTMERLLIISFFPRYVDLFYLTVHQTF